MIKKISPCQIPQTRLLFWPNLSYEFFHFSIRSPCQHQNFKIFPADPLKNFNPHLPRLHKLEGCVPQEACISKISAYTPICVNVLASNDSVCHSVGVSLFINFFRFIIFYTWGYLVILLSNFLLFILSIQQCLVYL